MRGTIKAWFPRDCSPLHPNPGCWMLRRLQSMPVAKVVSRICGLPSVISGGAWGRVIPPKPRSCCGRQFVGKMPPQPFCCPTSICEGTVCPEVAIRRGSCGWPRPSEVLPRPRNSCVAWNSAAVDKESERDWRKLQDPRNTAVLTFAPSDQLQFNAQADCGELPAGRD